MAETKSRAGSSRAVQKRRILVSPSNVPHFLQISDPRVVGKRNSWGGIPPSPTVTYRNLPLLTVTYRVREKLSLPANYRELAAFDR